MNESACEHRYFKATKTGPRQCIKCGAVEPSRAEKTMRRIFGSLWEALQPDYKIGFIDGYNCGRKSRRK